MDVGRRILVTGANGFVGRMVCKVLTEQGLTVLGAVRTTSDCRLLEAKLLEIGDIGASPNWGSALDDIDVVVHLAARVHMMKDSAADPLTEFRRINVKGTEHLARQAASRGVRRFVFLSSVKAMGEERSIPYTELDSPQPRDPYGVSKVEAEQVLRDIEKETGMEVVILRPPMVYGPGVKGNFSQLLTVVKSGIPLPIGSAYNSRSMIYVGNLADVIRLSAVHEEAAGKTYLVSDGEDISTPDLVRRVALQLGVNPTLIPLPQGLIRVGASIVGKSSMVDRLFGSLTVDTSRIRDDLGWVPPYSLAQGLEETVRWFSSRGRD